MARKQSRPPVTNQLTLEPLQNVCHACRGRMRMDHHSHRTVTTLHGVTRLTRHPSIVATIERVSATTNQLVQRKKGYGRYHTESSDWM
jgi:hypothetical protein